MKLNIVLSVISLRGLTNVEIISGPRQSGRKERQATQARLIGR